MKLVYIALAMACSDILGTSLVIAESRGRAWLAGVLDALSDVSGMIYLALGIVAISKWNWHSVITLLVITSTSLITTAMTVSFESREKRKPSQKSDVLPIDLSSGADVVPQT